MNVRIDIDRIRVVGAAAGGIRDSDVRSQVEQAVTRVLETAPLPRGRAMHASIEISVPSIKSASSVAGAIAHGVTRALGGRSRG
jgi:hypothetical protein